MSTDLRILLAALSKLPLFQVASFVPRITTSGLLRPFLCLFLPTLLLAFWVHLTFNLVLSLALLQKSGH